MSLSMLRDLYEIQHENETLSFDIVCECLNFSSITFDLALKNLFESTFLASWHLCSVLGKAVTYTVQRSWIVLASISE